MNLATIKAALKSPKTPASLKRGLIKKYGDKLGKVPMSALATTVRGNPFPKSTYKVPKTKVDAFIQKCKAEGKSAKEIDYLLYSKFGQSYKGNPAKKRKFPSIKKELRSLKPLERKIDKLNRQMLGEMDRQSGLGYPLKTPRFRNPEKKEVSLPKATTNADRWFAVEKYWDGLKWKDRNALAMMARVTDFYYGHYDLRDSFRNLPQTMRGILITHLYKLKS